MIKEAWIVLWLFMPREHNIMGVTMSPGWVSAYVTQSTSECGLIAMDVRKHFKLKALCLKGEDVPDGPMSKVVR